MAQNDAVYTGSNTAHRLSILFCLDVSPSMSWPDKHGECSIDLLNTAVRNFVEDLKTDTLVCTSAEVAFVTFSSDVEMDTEFRQIGRLQPPVFRTVEDGGTQLANAVLRAIEKIEMRRDQLDKSSIDYYAPFLVLVTDGNPDRNDDPDLYEKAVEAVKRHCDSHIGAREIIIPFIIGVGERVNKEMLIEFSAGFREGCFHIGNSSDYTSNQFNQIFKMIGNSTKKSVHLNRSGAALVNEIRDDILEMDNLTGC